jgi:hypothetical protein
LIRIPEESSLQIEPAEAADPAEDYNDDTDLDTTGPDDDDLDATATSLTASEPQIPGVSSETGIPGVSSETGIPGVSSESRIPRLSKKNPNISGVSGVLSGTLRLFVEGLDEDGYVDDEGSRGAEISEGDDFASSPSIPTTDSVIKIPRTIKPTVLGWIVILAVVVGASLFVVFKKTDWLAPAVDDPIVDTLKPEDIKDEPVKKEERFGSIHLVSQPQGASIFIFRGETPAAIEVPDTGRTHVIKLERSGYRGVYRSVEPSAFQGGRAEIKVTLEPSGAGADTQIPEPGAEGAAPGEKGTLVVESDPPKAMVWHLLAKGVLELDRIPISKSYYFKVALPGHRATFVRVSAMDFKEGEDRYSTTIKLEPDLEPETKVAPQPKAPAPPRAVAKPAPAPKPKARPVVRRRRPRKPQRRPSRRRGKPRKTKSSTPKLTTPDWAQ